MTNIRLLTLVKHTVVMNFDYAGGGAGKSANVTLLVDGKKVADGNIPKTVPSRFQLMKPWMLGKTLVRL